MDAIFESLQWIVDGLGSFKEESDSLFQQFLLWIAISYIEIKIWVVQAAWGVSSVILDSFNLGDLVGNAFGGVDSVAMSYINYFRLIDCINVLLNAVTTRFILSMVGW